MFSKIRDFIKRLAAMFSPITAFVKVLLAKEAARVVTFLSVAAGAAALKFAEFMGVTLSPEALTGFVGFMAFFIAEVIRKFVYSENTVINIAATAAETGDPVIGPPPSGVAAG